MRSAIMCLCKNEELYLDEWIDYHTKLGINHFFIFDNSDLGIDLQFKVIQKHSNVTYIDLRGRSALINAGMQPGCYKQIYNEYGSQYDYIIPLDVDEFMYFNQLSFNDFVSQNIFDDCDIIHLNWRYYGDNDLVFYDKRPVIERFPNPAPDLVTYAQKFPENEWVKSIIKTGKPLQSINAHTAVLYNGVCRLASGDPGKIESMREPINFTGGFIKHYGTKTIGEYVIRKCFNTQRISCNEKITASQRLNWFFNVNKHTKEKDLIANWFYQRGL